MQIKCTLITEKTKELASKIGKSVHVTQNIIDTWRTYNGNSENEYPTMQELQDYLDKDSEYKKEIFFAVPCYNFKGYDPKSSMIGINERKEIELMQFPGNSLGYFWNKVGERNDLKPYITTTEDAYRWLLWRQMSIMQNGNEKSVEADKIADAEATEKIKKWKAHNPDYTSGHTLVDIVEAKFGGYFEGGGAIIENDYPNIPAKLIRKLENSIMGYTIDNPRLNEKEALEFLQNSEPSLIPADVQVTVAKQQSKPIVSTESTVFVTGSAKDTAYTAKKNNGIDTLRHPRKDGMHFGNPFTHMGGVIGTIKVDTVKEAAEAYDAWLRGDEYYKGIKLAFVAPERRQWIVDQILDGSLKGKQLVYYTDKVPDESYGVEKYNPITAPNHAHILADYINGKRQIVNADMSAQRKTGIQAVDDAMEAVDNYTKWQKKHITFDKKHHKYYYNGNPIDNTVTEYGERIFGKPNIQGDYKFTQEMGNDTDRFTRDWFLQRFDSTVDPMKSIFPNLTDARKQELKVSEQRLESYIRKLYGDKCQIITRDLMLAGKIKTDQGDETIAGTIDMMVIDEQGNVHLLDMKTKGHSIDKVVRGKVVDDRRNYTFQLNAYKQLIEVCMPELAGKIKDLTLIWFDNVYPKQIVTITNPITGESRTYGEAKYTTNPETGEVTVSDRDTPEQPLGLYYKWHTPSLKADIKESLIPLDINQEPLQQVRPIVNPAQISTASASASTERITTTLGPETKMNIWHSSGENPDLSNMAKRPFPLISFAATGTQKGLVKLASDPVTPIDRIRKILNNSNLIGLNDANPIKVNSVENLFQALKVLYADDSYFEKVGDDEEFRLSDEGKRVFLEILNASPSEAKRKGGRNGIVKNLYQKTWDEESPFLMKEAIRQSFLFNKESARKLLNTGNATLTHDQDNTRWKEEFPKLLMEVRGEFREESGTSAATEQPSTNKEKTVYRGTSKKGAIISKRGYLKGDPQNHPDVDFTITENAEAFCYVNGINAQKEYGVVFPFKGTPKINVSDMHGTNQAGIRTDSKGNVSPNVHGIIVKKFQQNSEGYFVKGPGQFQDTDSDFNMFKALNEISFDKLEKSPNEEIVFPQQLAMGKAALPGRFVDWLQAQLKERYGLDYKKKRNPTQGYSGYGLEIATATQKNTPQIPDYLENFNMPDADLPDDIREQVTGIPNGDNTGAQPIQSDYNTPEIGDNAVELDATSEMAKLAMDFTPMQLYDRAENMARLFSEKVTTRLNELIEQNAQEMTAELNKEQPDISNLNRLYERAHLLNDADKGRKFAIQDLTLKSIFDSMREEYEEKLEYTAEDFEEEYGKGVGEYMVNAYQKIVEHFDEILKDACNLIEGRENIRIIVEKGKYNKGLETEDATIGFLADTEQDELIEDEEFGDDEDGKRVEGNEGWSYKVRLVDPVTSMSKDVKNVIYGVLKYGFDGKPETDDLFNPRYINGEYAHAVLINSLSNMVSPDDFSYTDDEGIHFPALEKLSTRYPWVSQIINALKDNPRLVSAFYADLRKDFIPTWIQYRKVNEDGSVTIETAPVNRPVARESTKNAMIDNYEQGTVLDPDSIYDAGRKISKENAEKGSNLAKDIDVLLRDFDTDYIEEDDFVEMINNSAKIFRMVGTDIDSHAIKNLLKSEGGKDSLSNAVNAAKRIFDGVLSDTYKDDSHLITNFNSDYNVIAKEVGLVSELNNISSFRIGDDTYYSYSAPNYVDTMFKNFLNDDKRDAYIENQFGQYWWFFDRKNNRWRSEWLKLIKEDEDVRDHMELKELKALPDDETGDLTQYKDWAPKQIRKAFIREYFSAGYNEKSQNQYAWYNFPIFSDSPVVKFIKFKRYVNTEESTFEQQLLPLFLEVAQQELERMELVRERKKKGAREIANYDKNGDSFHFFPELNEYRDEIDAFIKDKDTKGLDKFLTNKIREILNNLYLEFRNSQGVEEMIDTLKKEGVASTDVEAENALREYFWNQAYATTQIIELCTTDLAYYKNGTDFQKRFKEVYAAGTKLNTNSTYGKKIERGLYLADQITTSSSYQDIRRSLNRATEGGRIQSYDRDNILNKFKDINNTDAQAYRNLPSMRSLLDMVGKWDDAMEAAYERFENGEWNMGDFNLIWQTIKPFVYTQIGKPDGVKGRIKVPHQNKNSEFLLLAFYQLIAGSEGKSAKLRAIDRFMRDNNLDVTQFESSVKAGCQGVIDISYSKKKLNDWKNNNEDKAAELEEAAKEALKKKYEESNDFERFKAGNDWLLDNDKITQKEYNDRFDSVEPDEQEVYDILEQCSKDENGEFLEEVLHEIPYEDYCIQQPTPEHLMDHIAVFGSQFRNLIIADMPDNPDFRVKVNGKEYTKEEVIHLYNSLIVENLLEDWSKLEKKFSTIEDFQKALEDTIKGNPKYGRDMLNAIQLVTDPETGEKTFNIPLDNPSTTIKLQEIITSMFKNAITKQSIKGGACILVSDFGFTRELNLRHDKETGALTGIECYMPASSRQFFEPLMVEKTDDKGRKYKELDISKLPEELRKAIGYRIPTEDKYSMAPLIIKGFLPQQNGSSIMLPADITQIAGSDFDIDKMFLMLYEFRIDEYDKGRARRDYERIKEIEKQFIPTLNAMELGGEKVNELISNKEQELGYTRDALIADTEKLNKGIDLPEETLDKMAALRKFIQDTEESQGYSQYDDKGARAIKEQVSEEDIEDPSFNAWFNGLSEEEKEKYKYDTPKIRKREYNINKTPQEQKRAERNNMIIDIAYGILTNPHTAESIHNPGSFDTAKIAARVAKISTDIDLLTAFAKERGLMEDAFTPNYTAVGDELLKLQEKGDLKTLDKFLKDHSKERSQLTPNTFVYNHYQNMTGGALIGQYANNTSMQAKYQRTRLAVKDDFVFTINGYKMKSLHDIFSERGERISKNCANFSAASVDNVKDPVLADLMQNRDTANIAGTMLRLGMSIQEIGLLFTQPDIKRFILSGSWKTSSFKQYIDDRIEELHYMGGGVDTNISSKNFTSKELMDNIVKEHNFDNLSADEKLKLRSTQIQAMLLMHRISQISDDLSELTRISRADSPNGAIDITIAGSKMQIQRINRFFTKARTATKYRPFTLIGIDEGLKNGFVNSDMSIDELREKLLSTKLPMLQAFYSLGIEFSSKLLGNYFSQGAPKTDTMVDMLFDMSDYGILQEDLINAFYSEIVTFALTKSALFGDDPDGKYDKNRTTYEEKRDYYLYDFVKEYQRILADNPDIANMNIFKRMQVVEGTIMMKRAGKLTPYMRQSLMRDFDMLLYMDNPDAIKLAIGLFMYSFYKDGFKFGPGSFGTFFSTSYIGAFPEFISTLRKLRSSLNEDYFNQYLPQFIANHWSESKFLPKLKNKLDNFGRSTVTELNDGTGRIVVRSLSVRNYNIDHNNLKPGYKHSKPYVIYDLEVAVKNPDTGKQEVTIVPTLYALVDEGTNSAIYAPAAMFDKGPKNAVMYNANSTALKMNDIKTDASRVEANLKVNPKRRAFFDMDALLNNLDKLEKMYEGLPDMDTIEDKFDKIPELSEDMLDKIEGFDELLNSIPSDVFDNIDKLGDSLPDGDSYYDAFDSMPEPPELPDTSAVDYLTSLDERYTPEKGETQLKTPLCNIGEELLNQL